MNRLPGLLTGILLLTGLSTAKIYSESDPLSLLLDTAISDTKAQSLYEKGGWEDTYSTPVLGWSRNGKIAFIYRYSPREPVGDLSDIVILDLITDRELFRAPLADGSAGMTGEILQKIRTTFRNYSIIIDRTPVKPFPLEFQGDSLTVRLEENSLIAEYKNSGKIKKINNSDVSRFIIEGYALSPWEKRIAVYYSTTSGETYLEIAEYEAYSSFLGCHLTTGFK